MNSDGRSIRDTNVISTTVATAQITTMTSIRTQIQNEAKDDPGAAWDTLEQNVQYTKSRTRLDTDNLNAITTYDKGLFFSVIDQIQKIEPELNLLETQLSSKDTSARRYVSNMGRLTSEGMPFNTNGSSLGVWGGPDIKVQTAPSLMYKRLFPLDGVPMRFDSLGGLFSSVSPFSGIATSSSNPTDYATPRACKWRIFIRLPIGVSDNNPFSCNIYCQVSTSAGLPESSNVGGVPFSTSDYQGILSQFRNKLVIENEQYFSTVVPVAGLHFAPLVKSATGQDLTWYFFQSSQHAVFEVELLSIE